MLSIETIKKYKLIFQVSRWKTTFRRLLCSKSSDCNLICIILSQKSFYCAKQEPYLQQSESFCVQQLYFSFYWRIRLHDDKTETYNFSIFHKDFLLLVETAAIFATFLKILLYCWKAAVFSNFFQNTSPKLLQFVIFSER